MLNMSLSAERQPNVAVESYPAENICRIYVRKNHREVVVLNEGSHWECDEAYMELPLNEQPDTSEVEEDLDNWYNYAESWTQTRSKSLAQLQADIEYIADVSGIDLEV